ncbi:MAG: ABC transporter substrate-binding protein [Terricaulis sp.]
MSIIRAIRMAVVAACVLGAASCSPQAQQSARTSALEQIRATHTIVAGWAPYAPYAYIDPATRQPNGFYIELFERMASEAGLQVRWVETTWGNMVPDLETGRFQVMAAPTFRTIPRAMEVGFTRPIDRFGLSAMVRSNDQRFHTLADFRRPGIVLAVTQGEVGYEYATRHLPGAQLQTLDSGNIALALTNVVQGRADASIADAWTIKQFVAAHPGAVRDVFADEPFNQVGAGWFTRRDDVELLTFLNTSIDWLVSSGEVEAIAHKYEIGSRLVEQ